MGTDREVNVLELKLKALLLDTIHHIHIIEQLTEANVTKITDWAWQKQLRSSKFYFKKIGLKKLALF